MSLALIVRQSFIVSQSKSFAFLVQVSLKRKTQFFQISGDELKHECRMVIHLECSEAKEL